MTEHELLAVYLDLVAAKAKQMAADVKGHRMWPGDVQRGMAEIEEILRKANHAARDHRG